MALNIHILTRLYKRKSYEVKRAPQNMNKHTHTHNLLTLRSIPKSSAAQEHETCKAELDGLLNNNNSAPTNSLWGELCSEHRLGSELDG